MMFDLEYEYGVRSGARSGDWLVVMIMIDGAFFEIGVLIKNVSWSAGNVSEPRKSVQTHKSLAKR